MYQVKVVVVLILQFLILTQVSKKCFMVRPLMHVKYAISITEAPTMLVMIVAMNVQLLDSPTLH